MVRRVAQLCINVCLAVASVVVTVALVEGGARWLNIYVPFSLYPSPDNCMERSPTLSLQFRPHCTGNLSATPFHTNALGLRGDEVRDDGSIRILAIGDSCTWGWQVQQDETYPARLQQLLDYRWGAGRYQVINAGVPGYTSYQGLVYLRDRGIRLKPALVIAAFGFNDASPGGDVAALIARQAQMMTFLKVDDWLMRNSYVYARVRSDAATRQGRAPEERVAPEKYRAHMESIVLLAREHGAAVAFGGFASGFKNESARKKVIDEQHVPFVRYTGPKLDLVHPTAEGYRDFVAALLDRLTVDGVLESLRQQALVD